MQQPGNSCTVVYSQENNVDISLYTLLGLYLIWLQDTLSLYKVQTTATVKFNMPLYLYNDMQDGKWSHTQHDSTSTRQCRATA